MPSRSGRRRAGMGLGDIGGGVSGAITSVPGNIAIGFVALSPLGAAGQGGGIGMALLAAAVGGAAFTSVARTRGLLAGGSMSFALVVAGVLATLVQGGVLQPGLAGLPGALAVVALLTLSTGLCEAALAYSGMGQLVTMMPYPVVSGIRNGVALLMVLVQLRPMLGVTGSGMSLRWSHPVALVVAGVTLALMLRPVRSLRPAPPALVAVLAGAGVHYLAATALVPRGGADLLSPRLDVLADGVQHLRALADGWAALPGLPFWPLAATLLPAALTIALVSALETLVGASVMQDISGEHGSSRADLVALAAANVACGLCGSTPVTGGSPASMAVWSAGGRTRLAGLVRAAVLLAFAVLGGPLIGLLPTAALAGLVVGNGLQAFDRDVLHLSRGVLSRHAQGRLEMAGNVLVTATVTAAAVTVSLVAAVFAGLLLSAALFVTTMSGSAVRRRYRNPGSRSRTLRPEQETEVLLRHGTEIEVIELQGALFFGSADRLAREVEAAWDTGARCVILDFRRVSHVDLSGRRRLLQVATRHWERGSFLAFTGLDPSSAMWAGDGRGLRTQLRSDRVFPTLEEALSEAETVLLAAYGFAQGAGCAMAGEALERLGISRAEVPALLARASEEAVHAGTAIIAMGERAGAVFILLEGEVAVMLPGKNGTRTRLATLTAGTLFGEMALLSGAPRSADVVALTPVRCLSLDVPAIEALRETRPDLAYQLLMATAAQLARNVAMANVALEFAGE